MPIGVNKRQGAESNKAVKLKQRTYLDDKGKAVAEGDPGAVSLLGTEGKRISAASAKRAGVPDGSLKSKAAQGDKSRKADGNKGAGE